MIQTVISDLGKVIIFFDNQIFFRRMAQFCPLTEKEIGKLAFENSDLVESFDRGKVTPREFYQRAVDKLKVEIEYEHFFSIYNDVFFLNPPVVEIIKKLKTNYKLILLSNTDVMRFGFIKNTFPEVMMFNAYVLSYEVGFMKPHPQIYREALKIAGTRAEECVFIDDREENIRGAENQGIRGILYTPRMDLEAALRGMGLSL